VIPDLDQAHDNTAVAIDKKIKQTIIFCES
jgi:hypothetical protein